MREPAVLPYRSLQAKDPWLTTESAPDVKERRKTRDSLICQIHWRRIILDEAHNIKNHKCMTSIATCYIEAGEFAIEKLNDIMY